MDKRSKTENEIRKKNLHALRQVLRGAPSATKPQIARRTGLSVVTVGALVGALLERGELREERLVRKEQGRPAMAYSYNGEYRLALLLYVLEKNGREIVFVSVHDLLGRSLKELELAMEVVSLTSFDGIIARMLAAYPHIGVIAFGLPAAEINGSLMVTHLRDLRDTAFRSHIEGRFARPVLIENDVNAAIYGYSILNNGQGRIFSGLYLPRKNPPGAGVCVDCRPMRGRNGMAGEVQYLPLGIDWAEAVCTDEGVCSFFVKTVKTMMIMYNPHVVVVYSERAHVNFRAALMEDCQKPTEKAMLPEIDIKPNLHEDFKAGIGRLALERLDQDL